MKTYRLLIIPVLFLVLACNISRQPQSNVAPDVSTATTVAQVDTSTSTVVDTATETFTPTFTPVPADTLTPSITPSPTIVPSATFAFPTVTVNKQAHCRYGPSVAYLHAADLFAGDIGTVRGRYLYSRWLLVKFDKLNYFCWVAPTVVDVVGDISKIKLTELNLQAIGSNQYGPPHNVQVVRDGNKVTVSWDQVVMTLDKDRGYMWELFICQNGNTIWWTDSYPDQYKTSFTVKDEAGCSEPSSGLLYTVEKHGFSEPVKLVWPKP